MEDLIKVAIVWHATENELFCQLEDNFYEGPIIQMNDRGQPRSFTKCREGAQKHWSSLYNHGAHFQLQRAITR
jgi:hypothetical protein